MTKAQTAEYMAAYRQKNAARIRAQRAEYYARNAERCRAYSRAWGIANRKRKSATTMAWAKRNAKHWKSYMAAWRALNRIRLLEYGKSYRLTKQKERSAYRKGYYARFTERENRLHRLWLRINSTAVRRYAIGRVRAMASSYISSLIRRGSAVPSRAIPQELIQLKRAHLQLFRAIRGA